METDGVKPVVWRCFAPDLTVVLWGLSSGIVIPFLMKWAIPEGTCDSQFQSSLPSSSLLFGFIVIYPWVGIVVTIIVAARALKGRPDWLILVHGPIAVGVSGWILVVSGLLVLMFVISAPGVKDQLVIEGKQYVLMQCTSADLEGGDVGLYLCDDEKLRSCHLLVRGGYGMMQDPSLRYEDGALVVDDTLFDPLIYPLDDE